MKVLNDLVVKGTPFREAYQQVSGMIADGAFSFAGSLDHTHKGSIGNLCNEEITAAFENSLNQWNE